MQVAMQVALLERQSLTQLQEMWQKYFDTPPISKNKEFYISRLAYRIQELAYGGLSSHQQQVIANMHVPSRSHNNLPPTGTRIVREYLGVDHVVVVLPDGFEFNGLKYQTLSAVAKKITGRKIKEQECRLLFSVEGFLRKRFGSVWTRMRPEAVCGQARFGDNSVGKLRGIL